MSAKAPEEQAPPARWTTAQHEGSLLLFFPSELREGIKTSQGVSDAVLCRRVVDLDAGQAYEAALIFGAALVPNIKGGIPDAPVCGRLLKSERGAWLLSPHSQEELYVAQKWITENLT
jgi:hypothetical protein